MLDVDHERHARVESGCGSLAPGESAGLRAAKLAKSAGGRIAQSDLLAVIRTLPPQTVAHIRQKLKVRRNAQLTVYAQALRATLGRATEDLAISILHDTLADVVEFTSLTEDLDRTEMAAVLAGAPEDLPFLADSELLAELLEQANAVRDHSVWVAGWSSMVCSGHAGSTAALGWLVADPPDWWTADQLSSVITSWELVRARVPELPEKPQPLNHLVRAVMRMDSEGAFTDGVSALPARQDTGTETRPDELGIRCDDLERLARAVRTEVLPAIAAELEAGRIPDSALMARLLEVADAMSAFFADVAEAVHEPPSSLAHARDLLDGLTSERATTAMLDRVWSLTRLSAPAYLAAEAAAVARIAAEVNKETDPELLTSLEAFLTVVELAGSDPERGAELARTVQVGLSSAMPLLMVAGTGGLKITSGSSDSPPDQPPFDDTLVNHVDTEAADRTKSIPEEILEGDPTEGTVEVPEPEDEIASDFDEDLAETIADLAFSIPSPPATDLEPSAAVRLGTPDNPVAAGTADIRLAVAPEDTPKQHTNLLSNLLRSQNFALASWLSDALDQPPIDSAAFRLTAHSVAICSSMGPNAAAFADIAKTIEADQLDDRLGLQMLVYAASVRAGLLSPITNAATILREATPSIVKTGQNVEELTEALLAAFYSRAHLTPQSADAVAEAAGAEAEHERLADAARSMLQGGPSRTIRYVAATELWQSWISPNGYLGEPLSIVASGSRSPKDVDDIRAQVAELRSRPNVESALDRDSLRLRTTKHRRRRIEARARDKILDWTGDVAALLARWVSATDNLNRPTTGTWMANPLSDLRHRVTTVRDQALSELATLAGSGSPVRDASIDVGIALLTESLDFLAATVALDKAEIPPDQIIAGQLALAADLPLGPRLQPLREVTVNDVIAASSAMVTGEDGWTTAFTNRLDRHDHVGAQILIATLRPTDPRLAQRLSAERDSAVTRSAEQLDTSVTELLRRIDSDRRFGRLNYDQWTDMSSRASAFQTGARGTRRDFDVMIAELGALEAKRATVVDATQQAARDALGELSISVNDRDRVHGCIDQGDITTANEFCETLRSGRDLPGPSAELQHLTRFYPAFAEFFATEIPTKSRNSPLRVLTDLIKAVENPFDTPLADLLHQADIDLTAVQRPTAAAGRIRNWIAVTETTSLADRTNELRAILEQLAFTFDAVEFQRKHVGKQLKSSWAQLSGVVATSGKALVPAFGTRMSPSGDSLRLLAVWGSPTPQELTELLRSEPVDHSVVVLYFGTLDPSARRELATLFHRGRKLPAAALIDDAAFAYLAVQPEASRDITMSITLPFTTAFPFTPDVAGLVSPEMFYGRTEERDKVVDMMGPCVVYGGRQLGKSALLRAAAREFDDGKRRHAIYQSIYKVGQSHPVDTVWSSLWPSLAEKGIVMGDAPATGVAVALTKQVERWIKNVPGRQLLLLLDESDFFLDGDATDRRFTQVTHFKELMEATDRAFKVVFAGLHKTARFERLANHPLAHFGDPVCVGPLAPQPAYDLLTQPLRALGYHFESDDEQAARVIALANNQPALIQLFGDQLLRNLHKAPLSATAPPHVVTGADITAVWSDDALRTSFRKRFEWTLNLDPRYKIIAYCVAFHAHSHGVGSSLTPAQLRSECEQWWPQGFAAEAVRTGEFHALLDECVDLGVLSYAEGGYRLRTPNILDLLGSRDDVDEVLEQAESTPLPESFDGSLMRQQFCGGPTRAPLTSQQIADLLAQRSQVRLVAGSDALTVNRCLRTLKDESGAGSQVTDTTLSQLRTTCGKATLHTPGKHAVVVVNVPPSTSHEDVLTAWTESRELIAVHSGGTLGIVIITTAAHAPAWVVAANQADASSSVVGLRRYGNTDLRLWLNETSLPFQDDASRDELLAVTGGWPVTVNRLAEELTNNHDSPTGDPLGRIRQYLADPVHAEALVIASGVRADRVLSQAWSLLCGQYAGDLADAGTFADCLTLHAEGGEPGTEALTELGMREFGYPDTNSVVDVLATLGVLVTAENGLLRVEPVLAKATAIAAGREHGEAGAG